MARGRVRDAMTIFGENYQKAVQEVREISEERIRELRRQENPLSCPDCGAEIRVEVDAESPHGYRIVHLAHAS